MADLAQKNRTEPGRPEEIPTDDEVRKALAQAAPGEERKLPEGKGRDRAWLAASFGAFHAAAVLFFLIQDRVISAPGGSVNGLYRLSLALLVVFGGIFGDRALEHFAIGRISNAVVRYNLTRIIRLVVVLGIVAVLGSVVGNFYTGLVSLGVMSIIVGLAVQTPMTSFIGWLYILIREPYRVGDRIQIGNATGDVIEVSYLDTTLWEFGGKYLSSDHPSGRIIKFPNSSVLNTAVYNYSWSLFPYIWNEIRLQVGYESDLNFIAETMIAVAEEEIGPEMQERIRIYRDLLAKTPVDELTVQEKPVVLFRANENTWLEAILRYLVDPKRAGRVKTALLKKLLDRLRVAPEKVLFPRGPNR
jgi:small-conductance mechanosensitive channel